MSNLTRLLNLVRRDRTMSVGLGLMFACGMALAVAVMMAPGRGSGQGQVEEKRLLNNDTVEIFEFVFPPGFRGDEHEAPVNEFAYVIDGEFSVVTRGQGKTVVKKGQVEFAPKG